MQLFHFDFASKDWLLDPDAPRDASLSSRALPTHVALVHSNEQVLKQWVAETKTASTTKHEQAASGRHPPSDLWAPVKHSQPASGEPLLLLLEDDAAIADVPEFVRRIDKLLNSLRSQSFHMLNLLSFDVPVCRDRGIHLTVRDAKAAGFDVIRPFLALTRTHGVLWSLEGARRMLANLPSGVPIDLYLRHLLRLKVLDVLISCDGLVREDAIGKSAEHLGAYSPSVRHRTARSFAPTCAARRSITATSQSPGHMHMLCQGHCLALHREANRCSPFFWKPVAKQRCYSRRAHFKCALWSDTSIR